MTCVHTQEDKDISYELPLHAMLSGQTIEQTTGAPYTRIQRPHYTLDTLDPIKYTQIKVKLTLQILKHISCRMYILYITGSESKNESSQGQVTMKSNW